MHTKITDILSPKEVTEIIQKVAENHKHKTFGSFTSDDIYQQACLICTIKIQEFSIHKQNTKKPKQALENFLNKVVSNRLKNFFRDNEGIHYKDYKSDKSSFDKQQRINLLNPIDVHVTNDRNLKHSFEENFESLDLLEFIFKRLDEENIEILESVLSGDNINSYHKSKLCEEVKKILNEAK
jgi:hypothetical protein